jgi:hypothetical protein
MLLAESELHAKPLRQSASVWQLGRQPEIPPSNTEATHLDPAGQLVAVQLAVMQ